MKDGYTAYPIRATVSLMPFDSYRPGAWLVTGVEVGHEVPRGTGVARGLMRRVLDDADSEGVVLYLSIEPDGTGLDEDQLRAWYERLGFVTDHDIGSDYAMVRTPKEHPTNWRT